MPLKYCQKILNRDVYAVYTVMSKQRQNITTKMFTHTHNANIYVGANKKQIYWGQEECTSHANCCNLLPIFLLNSCYSWVRIFWVIYHIYISMDVNLGKGKKMLVSCTLCNVYSTSDSVFANMHWLTYRFNTSKNWALESCRLGT